MIKYTTSVLSCVTRKLESHGIFYNPQITRRENEKRFPKLIASQSDEMFGKMINPKNMLDSVFAEALEERYSQSGWSTAVQNILQGTSAQKPKYILTTSAEELPYVYDPLILGRTPIIGVESQNRPIGDDRAGSRCADISYVQDNVYSICLHMHSKQKMPVADYTRVLEPHGVLVAMVDNKRDVITKAYNAMEEAGFLVGSRDIIPCTETAVSVYGVKRMVKI